MGLAWSSMEGFIFQRVYVPKADTPKGLYSDGWKFRRFDILVQCSEGIKKISLLMIYWSKYEKRNIVHRNIKPCGNSLYSISALVSSFVKSCQTLFNKKIQEMGDL